MPYPAHPCTPAPDLCTSHVRSSTPSPCDTAPNLRRAFASAVYALPTLPVSVPFLIPQSSRTVSDSRLNKSSACQPLYAISFPFLRCVNPCSSESVRLTSLLHFSFSIHIYAVSNHRISGSNLPAISPLESYPFRCGSLVSEHFQLSSCPISPLPLHLFVGIR